MIRLGDSLSFIRVIRTQARSRSVKAALTRTPHGGTRIKRNSQFAPLDAESRHLRTFKLDSKRMIRQREQHQQQQQAQKSEPRLVPNRCQDGNSPYFLNQGGGTPDLASSPYLPAQSYPMSSTKSIPISLNAMKRTASEIQLMEDEAVADYRDYCMFTRIVHGIHSERRFSEDSETLNNIIRTRHQPVQEQGPSSYMMDGLQRHSINTYPAQSSTSQKTNFFRSCDDSDGSTPEDDDEGGVIREPPEDDMFASQHADDDDDDGDEDMVFIMDL